MYVPQWFYGFATLICLYFSVCYICSEIYMYVNRDYMAHSFMGMLRPHFDVFEVCRDALDATK